MAPEQQCSWLWHHLTLLWYEEEEPVSGARSTLTVLERKTEIWSKISQYWTSRAHLINICSSRRGKPLFLSAGRYQLLEQQWLAHRFDHTNKKWVWHRDALWSALGSPSPSKPHLRAVSYPYVCNLCNTRCRVTEYFKQPAVVNNLWLRKGTKHLLQIKLLKGDWFREWGQLSLLRDFSSM